MRLTLDLDCISFPKMLRKLRLLVAMYPQHRFSVRRSAGGRGYHIIVYDLDMTFADMLTLRRWLGDDIRRILLDYRRHQAGIFHSVLFSKKGRKEAIKYA